MAEHPVSQFKAWMNEAIDTDIHQPNAMTLCTVDSNGRPSSRVVLLKDYDEDGFIFFTNYNSRKAEQLDQNEWVSLSFLWLPLARQILIEGRASRVDAQISNEYFESRPRGSQLGAWVSQQSHVLSKRSDLEEALKEFETKFQDKKITRPSHWGGYRVQPEYVEFWQGRPNRLHDRLKYSRTKRGDWELKRLYP